MIIFITLLLIADKLLLLPATYILIFFPAQVTLHNENLVNICPAFLVITSSVTHTDKKIMNCILHTKIISINY